MGQVTIYLPDEIEAEMTLAAKSAHVSKSKWIAGLIESKLAKEWPESVTALAGAWGDFPSLEEIRGGDGADLGRENF